MKYGKPYDIFLRHMAVAGLRCTKGRLLPRRAGLSEEGSLSIISDGKLVGFGRDSSGGGTAADETVRFCY